MASDGDVSGLQRSVDIGVGRVLDGRVDDSIVQLKNGLKMVHIIVTNAPGGVGSKYQCSTTSEGHQTHAKQANCVTEAT